MSETSYNGWPADKKLKTRPLVVDGVAFAPGIRDDDDVATVFRYIAEQWAEHVEPLEAPGCWGFSYRANVNDPTELSCHSSATAIDINAPKHGNGTEASADLLRKVNAILATVDELGDLVHWGGNWHAADGLTPDPMHFELHAYDLAMLHRVAERIRHQEDDMPYTEKQLTGMMRAAVKAELAPLEQEITALQDELTKARSAEKRRFANLRVILKERFQATDAELNEILGHLEPPADDES